MRAVRHKTRLGVVAAVAAAGLVPLLGQGRAAGAGLSVSLVWSKTLAGAPIRASSPVPASLDGSTDVMFGSLNGQVYALHLKDGSSVGGWPASTTNEIDSSPTVADVDGSGAQEAFVGSGSYDKPGGAYYSFDAGGHTRFRVQGSDPNQSSEAVYSTLALGDLDCDGTPDVVGGALGQQTYAMNAATGAVDAGWPYFTPDTVFSSPALVDLQGNGSLDVVEGGDLTTPHGGALRVVNGHGQELWQHTFDEVVTSSPAVGPVTAPNAGDIAVGTGFYWAQQGAATTDSTRLFLFHGDGTQAWSVDLHGYTRPSPALADLEGNGALDVVEGTQGAPGNPNSGVIYAVSPSGSVLPNWPQPTPTGVGAVYGAVTTADLSGNGYQDVLVPTGDGLYIYDGRSGAVVSSLAVNQIGMQNSALVVPDPGGGVDIVMAGTDHSGNGVVFDYRVASGKVGNNAWPMFRHDPAGSGSMYGAPLTTTTCSAGSAKGGYRLVASDGGVFTFGDARFYGSTGAIHLAQPIVGMARTPDDGGYWMVAADGGIFSFGDAGFHGSAAGRGLTNVVGMAATPSGLGYWIVDDKGGLYTYGDAHFFGSTGALQLAQPIVGMASTPDGQGYWLVAADGGIFSFGDAHFYGSTGAIHLAQPIVGMAATPDGHGYWFVARDGGIFTFGDAGFFGSTGAIHLNRPIVGMTPSG